VTNIAYFTGGRRDGSVRKVSHTKDLIFDMTTEEAEQISRPDAKLPALGIYMLESMRWDSMLPGWFLRYTYIDRKRRGS